MDAEVVAALLGAGIGLLGGGAVQFLFDRRRERAQARGLAQLLDLELLTIRKRLAEVEERMAWWPAAYPLTCTAWEEHRATIAADLANDELLVLHSMVEWVDAANREAARASGVRWPRRPLPPDPQFLFIVKSTVELASQTLARVQKRGGGLLRRRRIPEAIGPSLMAPCVCGHTFGQHEWRTKRRRLRTTRIRIGWADAADRCGECDCARFVFPDDSSSVVRWLRARRLLGQAPYASTGNPDP